MQILNYFPGQIATIFLEVTDGYNHVRLDSTTTPKVMQVIYPDLSLASGFPQNMTKIDSGLYTFQFTIPTGASSVGSYLLDVQYTSPLTQGGDSGNDLSRKIYQLIVNAPFGLYSATIG